MSWILGSWIVLQVGCTFPQTLRTPFYVYCYTYSRMLDIALWSLYLLDWSKTLTSTPVTWLSYIRTLTLGNPPLWHFDYYGTSYTTCTPFLPTMIVILWIDRWSVDHIVLERTLIVVSSHFLYWESVRDIMVSVSSPTPFGKVGSLLWVFWSCEHLISELLSIRQPLWEIIEREHGFWL